MSSTTTAAKTDGLKLKCGSGIDTEALHKAHSAAIKIGTRSLAKLAEPSSTQSLPRATDVNLRPPSTMHDWYFLKAPAAIGAGAGPITLSLDPDAGQHCGG